ncbi:Serine/threonine-protein kinase, active site [Sesbania bispinosa]|nr:Serine/threonine-protein kinase, active site [Sesbania bispinosa]
MKPFTVMLPAFWSICLHILVLLFILSSLSFGPNSTASFDFGNETDHLALLKLKESISNDPFGVLVSWNASIHFCEWHGITCMHQRVTELNLQGYQLHGSLSPHIGNLSFLTNLNLRNNSFYGKIPPELGRLLQLQQLALTNNSFTGEIPTDLTSCSDLEILFLTGNNLTGKIPIEIGSLQKLQSLAVGKNNLIGGFPPFIGNLSSLTTLSVPYNNLEGDIPKEICRLKNLTWIAVDMNILSGTFPSCLYNMSSLIVISAARNYFDGILPPNMFNTLPNLQFFSISGNQFSGPIPTSMVNVSTLTQLDIGRNNFVGRVPSLEKLQDLQLLNLELNYLGGNSTKDLEFLKSLTNCSKLLKISISYNNFGGSLPNSVSNLSTQLNYLYLGGNHISGKIPAELGNLISLTWLSMENNHFQGIIPATFGKYIKMQKLNLGGNKLSGNIPAFIGNLSQLFYLDLSKNMLEGNIPPSIGNYQRLQYLNLSQNNLRGTIPSEVFSLSSLTNLLDLSQNSLSGTLLSEVDMLTNIDWLDLSENHLSGNIPGTIGQCMRLEYLYLQGNSFHGIMPSSLASLKGLQRVDLSRNSLSGSIPKGFQNISFLEYLNVSYNKLNGEVPTEGVFQNANKLGVAGNNKLCGGIPELHLPPCPVKDMKHAKHHKLMAVIVSVVAFLFILSLVLTIYWMRTRNKKPSSDESTIGQLSKVSYQDLYHGTDGFSAENLIGSGSFGSVYKGNLMSEDDVVSVKVLNLQRKGAHKSFITECNALKNIRHRNLVKILTCCSSTDYKGQEFKALVLEYMKNGSLEQWLHPRTGGEEHPRTLDLDQRLNIIMDVASALHYLHLECEQMVLHCDLKPSNILLDDDMVAHVSDFGIARLVSTIDGISQKQTSTVGIKGTVGYAPPEYGVGSEVSTHGDMYSFGILVLEMLTGRRPTDEVFEDGQNLHKFVEISFPDNLLQILDPSLLPRDLEAAREEEISGDLILTVKKFLVSLFRIGLACSVESPRERMSIVDVIRELNKIRNAFLNGVQTSE